MDFILFAVALLTLFGAGLGGVLLLLPARRTSVSELLSLAFLLGAAIISLASFWLGFLLAGAALRWTLTAICLALGAIGVTRRGRVLRDLSSLWPVRRWEWWGLAALVAQLAIVFYLSCRLWLGWDALLIWELRARIASLNGGVIPVAFFTNPNTIWPHPSYPLLLPLTEAWLYGWLGRPSQELVKLLFPFFYLSAAGLLFVAGARFGTRRWQATLSPLLLFFVPLTWIGEGSVSSGYADFPLAVFYLAATLYALEYWQTGDGAALRLAGLLGAVLCWVKEEGAILWVCLLAVTALKVIWRREWARLLVLLAPGTLLLGSWRLFLSFAQAPRWTAFQPFTPATLWANLARGPVILWSVLREGFHLERWGVLWWAVAGMVLWAIRRYHRSSTEGLQPVLLLMVLLPLACYLGIYFFSAIEPVSVHIDYSLARLMLHIAPVALLFVVLAAAPADTGVVQCSPGQNAKPALLDADSAKLS